METKLKLKKTVVQYIPFPKKGQMIYRDTTLPGFGIRVGQKAKTYFVEKRVNGKNIRVSIGQHPLITTEQARKEAQNSLGLMALGKNPITKKREARAKGVCLQEAFNKFLEIRKQLKPRTIYDYKRTMQYYFSDWLSKPIVSITKDMIQQKHKKIGAENGEAQANLAMRILRAVFNFASGQYEDSKGRSILPENPVRRLSQTKAWFDIERRRSLIKSYELSVWHDAVMSLESFSIADTAESVRDYLIFLLFTGLRRAEGARLKWDQVDFKEKTFTITDTKNKEPLKLPLSDFLYNLLEKRYSVKVNEYVFYGSKNLGYITEPKRQIQKVIKKSGIDFTIHDLRRTFLTIAESLDIPAYALKKLVNHKMKNDVTAGYLIIDVERLRRPMQQITNFLLKKMNLKPTADIAFLTTSEKQTNIKDYKK